MNEAKNPNGTTKGRAHPGLDFKQRLHAGETLFGAWCALDSPATIEAVACLDFDWLLIDCEHGLTNAECALVQIQAADRGDKAVFVRVPRLDASLVGRVLDAGAHGVMVPKVNNAEQAALVVDACRYPPAGSRGIGPHRSSRYYNDVAGALHLGNGRTVIAVQIESAEAVESAAEILAVPGIDVAFIGPADLSASLGHFGDPSNEEVEAAIATVLDLAMQAGVATGIYCNNGKSAAERARQGFQMINAAADFGILVHGMRQQLKTARDTS